MEVEISYKKRVLDFKFEAGTSRGVLRQHTVYYVIIRGNNKIGVGEAAPLEGLSIDDVPNFQDKLVHYISLWVEKSDLLGFYSLPSIHLYPSIIFAFEVAYLDFVNGGRRAIFSNNFSASKSSIPINGLVWMGDKEFMTEQINTKLSHGYTCIKMKVGAIHFDQELALLKEIRKRYSKDLITLRVDANGAFDTSNALDKLKQLSELDIHSIEQPIKAHQLDDMEYLCSVSPLAIALDEELIGVHDYSAKVALLAKVKPQYIILKPTLLGGIRATNEWIEIADRMNIPWWITSALESNIGLNAIAQFAAEYPLKIHQGLGTGMLYSNNIESPLTIIDGYLHYDKSKNWGAL